MWCGSFYHAMKSLGISPVIGSQRLSNKWNAYILFLVWPFFSLVYAVLNYRSPWAKNVAWFFSGFFGYTFVISNEGMDANRYRSRLIELHASDLSFLDFLSGVYSGIYGRGDYLEPTLRYLVALFTDDYRVLFAIFGLVIGYFFSRNIWFLIEESQGKIKAIALPFLIMFIFLVPFWLINGFRFWTASHIFVYAVIQLLYYKNTKVGLICLFFAVFTHVAFLVPLGILIAYILMPKNAWFFLLFLLVSILFLQLELSFFINLIPKSIMSDEFPVVANYLNEEYAFTRKLEVQDLKWYAKYRNVPIYIYTLLSSLVFLGFRVKMTNNQGWAHIHYFGILLFSFVGVLNVIPSAARFFSVAYLFIFGAYFLMVQNVKMNTFSQWLFLSSFIFFLLPIAIQIRIGMDFMGPGTLIFNPLFSWALENTYAFKS